MRWEGSGATNVRTCCGRTLMGAVSVASVRTSEAQTALLLLLGDLGGALFLHCRGGFLLGRFLLCHALSHFVSPLMNG